MFRSTDEYLKAFLSSFVASDLFQQCNGFNDVSNWINLFQWLSSNATMCTASEWLPAWAWVQIQGLVW